MCFVPKVSLTTAILEFVIAFWIRKKFRKNTLTTFFFILLILLGIYQMCEFMLCVFGHPQIWGKLGFIDYTLIPAVTVYYALEYVKKKPYFWLIFAPAFFFIIFALLDPHFIIEGLCSTLFVTIRNTISFPNVRIMPIFTYPGYYYLYLIISVSILGKELFHEKEKNKRILYMIMIFSTIFTILPPLVLIIIIPSLGLKFPSIYCHFAMLITITAIISSYLDNKYQ